MKKILNILTVIVLCASCSPQIAARRNGDVSEVTIDCGRKIVNVYWVVNNLWVLTKEWKDGDKPETYVFQEYLAYHPRKVTLRECE
jgi:hypothetical protein